MKKNRDNLLAVEEKIAALNDISVKIGYYLKNTNLDYQEDDNEEEETNQGPILQVQNVQKYYSTSKKVLDDITFDVNAGEFFGIVGESGSGKSTLGKILVRIIPNSGGTILFDNHYISSKKLMKRTKKWLAQNIQMVFQSPISSLNPKKKVLELIKEPLTRSDMISKKVDILIELHKVLNVLFSDRIELLLQTNKNDYIKNYYACLIYAYFSFLIKFAIYKAYITAKQNHFNLNEFLESISAFYTRYSLNENTNLAQGFYAPLYNIENPEQLKIYTPVKNLNDKQKQELLNDFFHDKKLLDLYEIDVTNDIHSVLDFFPDIDTADDFIIAAVDELDENIKQVLNIVSKYFKKTSDITRSILKMIARKSYLKCELDVMNLYNKLQDAKTEYELNPLHEMIEKTVAKKQRLIRDFEENYAMKSGHDAKSILLTYLSSTQEEINSVKRSIINFSDEPFMFLYFEIKKCILKERYNVIKTLKSLNNLTDGQISFLIEKVSSAISQKYQPLIHQLQQVHKKQEDKNLNALDLANEFNQINQNLKTTWKQSGTKLSTYSQAIEIAKVWANENAQIQQRNRVVVNRQIQELKQLEAQSQKILYENRDQFLQDVITDLQKQYETAVKNYRLELQKARIDFEDNIAELNKDYKKFINDYDPYLNTLITQTKKAFHQIAHFIKNNKAEQTFDRSNVAQDLKRVQTGIESTFAEVREIVANTSTYAKLFQYKNPRFIRNKLIKHLTKLLVFDTLESVGLKQEHAFRYIYEFSGGQRQRIAIARALITNPKLIIADEPISALDVSIQAQVVNIMKNLAKQRNITFLFIAHDLSMVHYACDRIIIINKGHILEKGDTDAIFDHPAHPYTRTLLKAVPELSNINLNLAKESEKVYQPYGDYDPIENPQFYSLNNEKTHFVYGTKEQIKQWNPDWIIPKD